MSDEVTQDTTADQVPAPRVFPCTLWMKREGRPCGAPQHPVFPDRCARGHADMRVLGARTMFKPANWLGLQHSMRTERWPPGLEVLRDEVAAFMRGCLADEGDVALVPTRRLSLLGHRARIERRIIQIDARLEQAGLTDKRGKLRVVWLSQLQSLINTAKSLDQLLGLERKQKRVPSLADVMADDTTTQGRNGN
jgi:hypothetical protein